MLAPSKSSGVLVEERKAGRGLLSGLIAHQGERHAPGTSLSRDAGQDSIDDRSAMNSVLHPRVALEVCERLAKDAASARSAHAVPKPMALAATRG